MTDLCANDEWLAAYLDKRLSEEECLLYEMHLSSCQSCLAELIAAKTELGEMKAEEARETAHATVLAAPFQRAVAFCARAVGARSSWPLSANRTVSSQVLATSFSLAVALILAGGLFLLMHSPGWDPEFVTGKSNLARILATTDIGEMRLSRGPEKPFAQMTHFRGIREPRSVLFNRAAIELQNVGARYPNDWRSFALLGDLCLAAGRLESAEAYYAKALRLNQGDAGLLNDHAVAVFRQGDFDLSRRCFEDALGADYAVPETLYNLAILCRQIGERNSMKHYVELYLRQDSSSPWADRARALLTE